MTDDGETADWEGAIDELLDREDLDEELPDAARERIWASISASVGAEAEAGDSETGGDASGGAASGGADSGASGSAGIGEWLGSSSVVRTVASFLVGATAGAGGYALYDASAGDSDPRERVVYVRPDASVAADTGPGGERIDAGDSGSSSDANAGDADVGGTGSAAAPTDGGLRSSPTASEAGGEGDRGERRLKDTGQPGATGAEVGADGAADAGPRLSDERLVLSRAQAALGRGHPERALEALEEHAERYPDGRLAEERDMLRVRALSAAGRKESARRRAREFLETYSESIFEGMMRRILRESADASD